MMYNKVKVIGWGVIAYPRSSKRGCVGYLHLLIQYLKVLRSQHTPNVILSRPHRMGVIRSARLGAWRRTQGSGDIPNPDSSPLVGNTNRSVFRRVIS